MDHGLTTSQLVESLRRKVIELSEYLSTLESELTVTRREHAQLFVVHEHRMQAQNRLHSVLTSARRDNPQVREDYTQFIEDVLLNMAQNLDENQIKELYNLLLENAARIMQSRNRF